MRHLYDKTHLGRTSAHRKALNANMSLALFSHKKIVTTLAKAKYTRRFAERMINFAKRTDLSARRHVLRYLHDKDVVKILFNELGPHFKNRNGGYTRIIKLGPRRGDAAPMALLELVGFNDAIVEGAGSKKSKPRAKTASAPKMAKSKVPAKETASDAPVEEPQVPQTETPPDTTQENEEKQP